MVFHESVTILRWKDQLPRELQVVQSSDKEKIEEMK